ncbi:hypothetical protein [Clostridium tyrobutyricum]|uniref:hypothetical protein n=1 Tax=Clostridium tyrobutyricum TaxID=1519 RepID=UPI000A74735B|nr:hypothetical protein [Clostridium tyrobutyricum]
MNTYRNKIGGFRVSSANTNIMNIGRKRSVQTPSNNKFSFLKTAVKSNVSRMHIIKNDAVYKEQSSPVINIMSMNIKKKDNEEFNYSSYHNFMYTTWKNIMLVDTLYSKSIINLDISDIVFPPVPIKGGGITDMELTLISGKRYKIVLRDSDKVGISSVENLPASLSFDSAGNSIEGVVFLIGTTISSITLSDKTEVKLTFNVIPASLSDGI